MVYNNTMTNNATQLSIRLSPELHEWLSNYVSTIRPGTTINMYINHLIEQDRDILKLVEDYEVKPDEK